MPNVLKSILERNPNIGTHLINFAQGHSEVGSFFMQMAEAQNGLSPDEQEALSKLTSGVIKAKSEGKDPAELVDGILQLDEIDLTDVDGDGIPEYIERQMESRAAALAQAGSGGGNTGGGGESGDIDPSANMTDSVARANAASAANGGTSPAQVIYGTLPPTNDQGGSDATGATGENGEAAFEVSGISPYAPGSGGGGGGQANADNTANANASGFNNANPSAPPAPGGGSAFDVDDGTSPPAPGGGSQGGDGRRARQDNTTTPDPARGGGAQPGAARGGDQGGGKTKGKGDDTPTPKKKNDTGSKAPSDSGGPRNPISQDGESILDLLGNIADTIGKKGVMALASGGITLMGDGIVNSPMKLAHKVKAAERAPAAAKEGIRLNKRIDNLKDATNDLNEARQNLADARKDLAEAKAKENPDPKEIKRFEKEVEKCEKVAKSAAQEVLDRAKEVRTSHSAMNNLIGAENEKYGNKKGMKEISPLDDGKLAALDKIEESANAQLGDSVQAELDDLKALPQPLSPNDSARVAELEEVELARNQKVDMSGISELQQDVCERAQASALNKAEDLKQQQSGFFSKTRLASTTADRNARIDKLEKLAAQQGEQAASYNAQAKAMADREDVTPPNQTQASNMPTSEQGAPSNDEGAQATQAQTSTATAERTAAATNNQQRPSPAETNDNGLHNTQEHEHANRPTPSS